MWTHGTLVPDLFPSQLMTKQPEDSSHCTIHLGRLTRKEELALRLNYL